MSDAPDSATFLRAIELRPVAPQLFDEAFEATPQAVPWPKAYGGDAVAQALAAACATVDDDRMPHSSHSSFLRPVESLVPVRFEVERTRDGRGFSTRSVRGIQSGKLVFLSTVSFQVPEPGRVEAVPMPDAPAPEALPTSAEVLAGRDDEAARYWARGRSFDQRHVPGPLYDETPGTVREPRQAVWLRAYDRLPDDPRLHAIAVAYACDYTILEPSLRALGLHWSTPGLQTASLDHSMWFHTPARADDWLLYAQESCGIQSGRALNLGRFFTRDGSLVATVAQEGLLRHP